MLVHLTRVISRGENELRKHEQVHKNLHFRQVEKRQPTRPIEHPKYWHVSDNLEHLEQAPVRSLKLGTESNAVDVVINFRADRVSVSIQLITAK